MNGKHAAPATGSKKPLLVILIIVTAIAFFAAGVFVAMTFFNKDKPVNSNPTQPATQATQAAVLPVATDASAAPSVAPTSEEPMGTEATPVVSEPIQIPTHGGEISTFNATYVPGSAVDLASGADVSLRDALGKDFRSSTLTFNEDGTYVCNLGGLGTTVGMYQVEDGVITATDTTDRNMNITVTEWNEETNAPAGFYVIIGEETSGVKLLFSEN